MSFDSGSPHFSPMPNPQKFQILKLSSYSCCPFMSVRRFAQIDASDFLEKLQSLIHGYFTFFSCKSFSLSLYSLLSHCLSLLESAAGCSLRGALIPRRSHLEKKCYNCPSVAYKWPDLIKEARGFVENRRSLIVLYLPNPSALVCANGLPIPILNIILQ